MKRRIQNWVGALLFVACTGGATMSVAMPQTAFAACNDRLLTFPAWFKGLTDGECNIKSPSDFKSTTDSTGLSTFIWKIVLNVIEFGLQLAGYMAAAFIIVGGYKYIISAGSPDGMVKSRKTILNAVIGLVISMFSIAIVNVIAGTIK